jgi:hypothetical protein
MPVGCPIMTYLRNKLSDTSLVIISDHGPYCICERYETRHQQLRYVSLLDMRFAEKCAFVNSICSDRSIWNEHLNFGSLRSETFQTALTPPPFDVFSSSTRRDANQERRGFHDYRSLWLRKYIHTVASVMGVMLCYAVTAARVLIVRPCVSGTRSIFCKLSL